MHERVLVTAAGPLPMTVPIDREALRTELLGFRESVFRLCLGFSGGFADACDLTQETYAKALAHADRAPVDFLKPWILRIARNACLDQARRRRVRALLLPFHPVETAEWRTPESRAADQEQIRIVRRAIGRLPRKLRETLVLQVYAELSYEEIARTLKISRGTVMSRLNRARSAVLRLVREENRGKSHGFLGSH